MPEATQLKEYSKWKANRVYVNKDAQKIRQYEAENFEYSYKAYKALKGNSFIDKIKKEVDEWEVVM